MRISNINVNTNFKAHFSPRMNKYVNDIGNRFLQENNKSEFKEYCGIVKDIKSTMKCGTIDITDGVATFEHPLIYDNYQLADNITSESCGNLDTLKKISSSLKDIRNSYFKNKSDSDVFAIFYKSFLKK